MTAGKALKRVALAGVVSLEATLLCARESLQQKKPQTLVALGMDQGWVIIQVMIHIT